jgi:hypothetical protein
MGKQTRVGGKLGRKPLFGLPPNSCDRFVATRTTPIRLQAPPGAAARKA